MTQTAGSYEQISLGVIAPSTTNPRKSFDADQLAELKASIGELGIQVPLLVRRRPKAKPTDKIQYELVAGERRLRAAESLSLHTVPCIVKELTDDEAKETQVVENLQRADVHPVEEADAYAAMMGPDQLDMSIEDIAKKVGKTAGYVAARLRLRTLELYCKLLYIKGHITLGHALLLARLTPNDQDRALRFMLDSDPKYDKRPITEVVLEKILDDDDGGDDEDEDGYEDEKISYNMPNPQVQKYMRHGRRLVEATEAQLKRWIESNVLLKLASVPWRLDDDLLLPGAGACIDCPKRSGSNAALFGDLTAEADVCLDPACFSAKQDATVKVHKEAAKINAKHDGGKGWLLKISSKPSRAPLEEEAVGGGEVVTRKTVKQGQWVAATQDGVTSCENTVKALMVDGPDKGKLVWCCADQKCKVHKHEVQKPHSYGSSNSSRSDQAKEAAEAAKRKMYVESETAIRVAIYRAIRAKVQPSVELLRTIAMKSISEYEAGRICQVIELPIRTKGDEWDIRRDAVKVLAAYAAKATEPQLHQLLYDALSIDAINVREHNMSRNKESRSELWAMAKKHKVDAEKIALTFAPVKLVAPKPAAKKPAVRKLSPEARKRIAEVINRRWSAAKKKSKSK
jgi:ParB family chromosome partitioning protein